MSYHDLVATRFLMTVAIGSTIALAGCGGGTKPASTNSAGEQPSDVPAKQDGMTAEQIVTKMVDAYRETSVYADSAEYAEHFVMVEDKIQRQGPPMTVSVVFQRPNRFWIARVRYGPQGAQDMAEVACDGTNLEARISNLPDQRLSLPAPERATIQTVAPDAMLRESLFPGPPQDIFPQLALLVSQDGDTPWPLEASGNLRLLAAKDLKPREGPPIPCYRVKMATTEGPQICWIDKSTFLLLRLEIPGEELRKQLYPNLEFLEFAWRFDFENVSTNVQVNRQLFQLAPADIDTEMVRAFYEEKEELAAESDTEQQSEEEEASDKPDEEAADNSMQRPFE